MRALRSSRLGCRSLSNAMRWAANAECRAAIAGSSLVDDCGTAELELARIDMGTSGSGAGSLLDRTRHGGYIRAWREAAVRRSRAEAFDHGTPCSDRTHRDR